MTYKQQEFVSYSSGGWNSEIRLPAQLNSDEETLAGLQTDSILT